MYLTGNQQNFSGSLSLPLPTLHSQIYLYTFSISKRKKKIFKETTTQVFVIKTERKKKKHTWVIFRYMYWIGYTVKTGKKRKERLKLLLRNICFYKIKTVILPIHFYRWTTNIQNRLERIFWFLTSETYRVLRYIFCGCKWFLKYRSSLSGTLSTDRSF